MTAEKETPQREARRILYKGPSMKPLFQDLDFLSLVPCDRVTLKPGDVVLFQAPDTGEQVVHRVISFNNGEIRTKGDNNREMDLHVLTFSDIMGKVASVSRKGRPFQVMGGVSGLFLHHLFRASSFLSAYSRQMLKPLWQGLVFLRPLRWVQLFLPKVRIVSYKRPEGEERSLFVGHYPVARKKPSETRWVIVNRFFQLVIDGNAISRKGKK